MSNLKPHAVTAEKSCATCKHKANTIADEPCIICEDVHLWEEQLTDARSDSRNSALSSSSKANGNLKTEGSNPSPRSFKALCKATGYEEHK